MISKSLADVYEFLVAIVDSPVDVIFFFFFSSRRRHTRSLCDWSSDVCSSDLDRIDGPACFQQMSNQQPMGGLNDAGHLFFRLRSEERRVGKECRSRWSPYH